MIKGRLIFLVFCLSFLFAGTFTIKTESVYSADDEIVDQIKKDGPGNRFAIPQIQPLKGHKFGGYKPITFTDDSIEGDLICVADGMSAAGNGTVIRFINKIAFRDEIANLGPTKVYLPKNMKGFIFESQTDSPLSFVLLENYGLVYVSGHGSVTCPDNQIVKLPNGDLKSEETPGITFDSDKIPQSSTTGTYTGSDYKGNYVYSGAMNLAWNELNENILHEKLKLNTTDKKALEIVNTFNKTIFTKNDLDEASYYVKSGFRQKTVDIINKESRSKFPDKSFGDLKLTLQEKDIIAYAYFLKKVEYATPFVPDNVSFMGERIKGFCAKTKVQKANVEVLKYSDDNKFIIRLKLKDDSDELILAKGFDISSPEDIVNEIRKYDIQHLPAIGDSDLFEMPKLYLSHSRDYNEVIRKYLANKGFEKYWIEVMQENIKFYMDEKGSRVENEAVVAMQKECEVVKKGRYFVLNKPFWVVMKRKNSRNPYFILGVNNTELMERNIEIASTSGDYNGAVMPTTTITDTENKPESQTANEKLPQESAAPSLEITVLEGKKAASEEADNEDVVKVSKNQKHEPETPEQETRDNSSEIKGILNIINEAIRQGNVEVFYRFLNKENDGFYSREQKIIEDFGKEIQIHKSSFDDINITIDGNTASVQYAWSMGFTWNAFPEKKFENKSRISLKLKRTNNGWKIFDTGSTNL